MEHELHDGHLGLEVDEVVLAENNTFWVDHSPAGVTKVQNWFTTILLSLSCKSLSPMPRPTVIKSFHPRFSGSPTVLDDLLVRGQVLLELPHLVQLLLVLHGEDGAVAVLQDVLALCKLQSATADWSSLLI